MLRHHSLPVQLVKSVPSLTLDEAQDVFEGMQDWFRWIRVEWCKICFGTVEERTRANSFGDVLREHGCHFRRGRPNRRDYGIFAELLGLGRRKLGCSWRCRCNSRTNLAGTKASAFTWIPREFYVRPLRRYGERHEEIFGEADRGMGCSEVERKEFEECLEKRFSVDMILKRIHVFRCHEVTELLACLDHVPEFVKEHPKVKLVVIDSIMLHFRQDFDDMALRASILAKTTNNLMSLAKKYDLAVVTINQATTKPWGEVGAGVGRVVRARCDDESGVILGTRRK